jgi:thiol-disulfide isomerase/thioredoxin
MLAVAALRRVCPLAVVVAALAVLAPVALADGDPASDFLLSQSSFLSPYDGKIPASQQERIEAMLQSAKKQGFPLKLAVIVTRYDLGAVPILYRKPTYAKFLAQEDFYFWKDGLLVVMPNGYGLYKLKGLPPADKALIAKLPKLDTTDGPALATAAEQAITALAARRGLTLATGTGSNGTSVWVERGEIAGGALRFAPRALADLLWRREAGGGLRGDRGARRPRGQGRPRAPCIHQAYLARPRWVLLATSAVATALSWACSRPPPAQKAAPHVVTIPAADRSASPGLLREAEAVNFHPNTAPGVGQVEGRPLTGADQPAAKSLLPVGSTAPAFRLRTPTGKPLNLASLRGKAVLLELFATWCPHCAAEAPHLKAMYAKLPSYRYAFVSVNADSEDAASVLAYYICRAPFPALSTRDRPRKLSLAGVARARVHEVQGAALPDLLRDRPAREDRLVGHRRAAGRVAPAEAAPASRAA